MDIEECIFVGIVSSYGQTDGTVIVRRPDKDNRTTAELKVISRCTQKTKDYWMPDIDEQVVCLMLPNAGGKGAGAGFVLGAVYSETDPLPAAAERGVRVLEHPGDLVLNIGGTFKVKAGTLDVRGGGDVVASGISLVKHVHGDVTSGIDDTGKPN